MFHRLTHKVSKRSSAVWETYPVCERTVSHTRTLAFSALSPQADGSSASSSPGTSFAWKRLSHDAPRQASRGSKTRNARCAHIWSTMLWYGLYNYITLNHPQILQKGHFFWKKISTVGNFKWGKITTWQEVQATSAKYERSTKMHGAL